MLHFAETVRGKEPEEGRKRANRTESLKIAQGYVCKSDLTDGELAGGMIFFSYDVVPAEVNQPRENGLVAMEACDGDMAIRDKYFSRNRGINRETATENRIEIEKEDEKKDGGERERDREGERSDGRRLMGSGQLNSSSQPD